MEPVESKLKVEHAMETTFVTLQETQILEENQIKQLEEQIMPVVEKAGGEKLILNFANVQFMSSAFLGTWHSAKWIRLYTKCLRLRN